MKEIKILGAGLSGLTTAINLAKEGCKVKVFERSKDCGMRFNDNLQGLENWSSQTDILDDLKSMNVETNFYCEPFHTIQVYDFKLNKTKITSKTPIFYLVRRGNTKECLDIALKKQAINLGAEINFNKTMAEKDADIIATGPKRVDTVAKGITFNTKISDIAVGIFNDNIAPKGYAYLLVSKGKGTLATVLFKDFKNINHCFERTINTFNKITDLNLKDIREFSIYGNFFLNKRYEKDGKLFTGETVGLQGFFLMFGMRYAITSGYLAARSIIENKSYDDLIKYRFKNQLKTSIVNRFLFERMGNRGYQLFISKIKNVNEPVSFLNKYYNPSFFKKLIYPISKIVLKK